MVSHQRSGDGGGVLVHAVQTFRGSLCQASFVTGCSQSLACPDCTSPRLSGETPKCSRSHVHESRPPSGHLPRVSHGNAVGIEGKVPPHVILEPEDLSSPELNLFKHQSGHPDGHRVGSAGLETNGMQRPSSRLPTKQLLPGKPVPPPLLVLDSPALDSLLHAEF